MNDFVVSAEAAAALEGWSKKARVRFEECLEDAASELQCEMLQRAVAAGHTAGEIHAFADEIRGLDDGALFDRCTLGDGHADLTVEQLLRAQGDPLYAWELNGGELSPDEEPFVAPLLPERAETVQMMPAISAAERPPTAKKHGFDAMSEAPVRAPEPRAKAKVELSGGHAPARRANALFEDLVNDATRSMGISWSEYDIEGPQGMLLRDAVASIAQTVQRGIPVPAAIGQRVGDHRKFVIVLQVLTSGNARSWQLFEPFSRELVWVHEADVAAGNELPFADKANRRLTRIALPTARPLDGENMRNISLFIGLLASVALADAVQVSVTRVALKGQGQPSVNVHIIEKIMGFRLQLTRGDGKTFDIKGGGPPGVTRNIWLEQPEGRSHWNGTLTINLPNGTSDSMTVEFESDLFGPLKLDFDKSKDVDFANRSVKFRLNRPAGKAKLKVLMDTGDDAFDGEIPFDHDAPGKDLVVTWPAAKGNIMKVEITAYDENGYFTGLELTPWRIDIPHEEVNFASGKFDIPAAEAPKLEKSLGLINDAVAKYGSLARITLFVAGHTDTVGPAESNQVLSLNRARSLGQFFRKRGLRIPIRVEGFGENAAAVETPDETDEVRNRRAQYIISIDPPTMSGSNTAAKWQSI